MNFLFFILVYLLKFHQSLANISSFSNIKRRLQESEEENDNSLIFNQLFSDFKTEWENKMSDFISQYIYLIPIPYKKEIDYYEIITQIPCVMRGAFLNEDANSEKDVIDFKIISPNNTINPGTFPIRAITLAIPGFPVPISEISFPVQIFATKYAVKNIPHT